MMYLDEFVLPMREELTRVGFRELRTSGEVDAVLGNSKGTVLVVVGTVLGLGGAFALLRALLRSLPS